MKASVKKPAVKKVAKKKVAKKKIKKKAATHVMVDGAVVPKLVTQNMYISRLVAEALGGGH